jgi:hypothetical protein
MRLKNNGKTKRVEITSSRFADFDIAKISVQNNNLVKANVLIEWVIYKSFAN